MGIKLNQCVLGTVLGIVLAGPAWTHGDGHGHPRKAFDPATVEDTPFGKAADPEKPARVVSVSMDDRMRFTPAVVEVKAGETVRFELANRGKVLHEMVLGTEQDLARHAELMKKFPEMEHDEPNMLHVKPGHKGAFAWTFDKPGTFGFACLIPGHLEAGMFGRVVVR